MSIIFPVIIISFVDYFVNVHPCNCSLCRLSLFHNILGDMNQHPRVLVCSQVVPVLLRWVFNYMTIVCLFSDTWFNCNSKFLV